MFSLQINRVIYTETSFMTMVSITWFWIHGSKMDHKMEKSYTKNAHTFYNYTSCLAKTPCFK